MGEGTEGAKAGAGGETSRKAVAPTEGGRAGAGAVGAGERTVIRKGNKRTVDDQAKEDKQRWDVIQTAISYV